VAGAALDLGGRLQAQTHPAGTRIFRIHHQDNGPVWFGPKPGMPPSGRFDAPAGEFRVLYAALGMDGAFVETILHRPVQRIVKRAYVHQRSCSTLILHREIQVAALHGSGLLFHGAPPAISAGLDYGISRSFALAFYNQHPSIDGIAYRSSHNDDELCLALFDRVGADAFEIFETERLEDMPAKVDDMMGRHGAVFDTSPPLPPTAAGL
jgi:hypothetical protein